MTSSHNSDQTPQTPAASPPIHPDSSVDFMFGLCLLGFAHVEIGQYKNSPNAWKLTSKTAPLRPYRGKKGVRKKKKRQVEQREPANPPGSAATPHYSDYTYNTEVEEEEISPRTSVLACFSLPSVRSRTPPNLFFMSKPRVIETWAWHTDT